MLRGLTAGACLLLAAGVLVAEPAPAESLIATIRKIGKEGAGNAEAARAWKALVALGPDALAPILSGLNDDEAVAGNWLRPAFEAIAEKAARDGKLSATALEAVVTDRGKSGAARGLAYVWLVKQDGTAIARLLPRMLDDPAPGLRRLGVDHLVKQAEAASAKKDAAALYRKAFAAAGDPEQVEAIAKSLVKQGDRIDVARHLGLVRRWHLAAPFDHANGIGWDVAYPPEKGVDRTATYKGKGGKPAAWVDHTAPGDRDPLDVSKTGLVDLNKAIGPLKGTIAYAHAEIDMPAARTVELRAGCINALKVFVNGKKVLAVEEYHHGMRIDQYAVRVRLDRGRNEILLKVCQNEQKEPWAQTWQFQLRICDPVGTGVAFTQPNVKKEDR